MPWKRAFPVPIACAASSPVTLAVASARYPPLAAQWHDRLALAGFIHNTILSFFRPLPSARLPLT